MKKKTKKRISRKQFKGSTVAKSEYKKRLSDYQYNFFIELQALCNQAVKEKSIIELSTQDANTLKAILQKFSLYV